LAGKNRKWIVAYLHMHKRNCSPTATSPPGCDPCSKYSLVLFLGSVNGRIAFHRSSHEWCCTYENNLLGSYCRTDVYVTSLGWGVALGIETPWGSTGHVRGFFVAHFAYTNISIVIELLQSESTCSFSPNTEMGWSCLRSQFRTTVPRILHLIGRNKSLIRCSDWRSLHKFRQATYLILMANWHMLTDQYILWGDLSVEWPLIRGSGLSY